MGRSSAAPLQLAFDSDFFFSAIRNVSERHPHCDRENRKGNGCRGWRRGPRVGVCYIENAWGNVRLRSSANETKTHFGESIGGNVFRFVWCGCASRRGAGAGGIGEIFERACGFFAEGVAGGGENRAARDGAEGREQAALV